MVFIAARLLFNVNIIRVNRNRDIQNNLTFFCYLMQRTLTEDEGSVWLTSLLIKKGKKYISV
jgi:hypothetical protein